MQELFEESVRDIYNAEKQLLRALPKMIKSCQSDELRNALQNHLNETEEQVRRLEEACRIMGFRPSGVMCKGMQGLVEEANEHMKGMKPSSMTDAEIIASAQKAEHYEIASYGTICEWAKVLGHNEALDYFKMNLDEEEKADELLTQLAEGGINEQAAQDGKMMMERGETHRRTAGARSGTRSKRATASKSRAGGGRTGTRSTSSRSGSGRSTSARGGTSRSGSRTTSRGTSTRGGSRSTASKSRSTGSKGGSRSTAKRTSSRSAPKATSKSRTASRGTSRARTASRSAPKTSTRSRTGTKSASRATAKSRSRR